MRKNKSNFNLKWKIVENYVAAGAGLVFLWLFVSGMIENDMNKLYMSLGLLAIAPFLVTYIDKKSSGN